MCGHYSGDKTYPVLLFNSNFVVFEHGLSFVKYVKTLRPQSSEAGRPRGYRATFPYKRSHFQQQQSCYG